MEINKDTKLVKIKAEAEGYYSGSYTSGAIFIPECLYKLIGNSIDKMNFCISELDGKHSETDADISISFDILENFIQNPEELNNLDDYLLDELQDALNLKYKDMSPIIELNEFINSLSITYAPEEKEIYLDADTIIQNVILPKNTIIKYSVNPNVNFIEPANFNFTNIIQHIENN